MHHDSTKLLLEFGVLFTNAVSRKIKMQTIWAHTCLLLLLLAPDPALAFHLWELSFAALLFDFNLTS